MSVLIIHDATELSWRIVFNTELSDKLWGHIDNANKAAHQAGYKYFAWNGFVYTVNGSNTNIKIDQL